MDKYLKEYAVSDEFHPYLENLSENAKKKERIPFIGRESELEAVKETLLRKLKSNLLLVGKPGVGKTGLITKLAEKINAGDVPSPLKDKIIFELSMNRFFLSRDKGDQLVKDFERLFITLKQNREKLIIFLNEMEMEAIAGSHGDEQSLKIQNLLKSYFITRDMKLIAATTPEYYYKFIKSDEFLSMNFSVVFLNEPDEDEMLNILEGTSGYFEDYYSLKIKKRLFKKICLLSKTFIPHEAFPRKGVDLLDISCSKSSVRGRKELEEEDVYKSIAEISGLPVEIIKLDQKKHTSGILKFLKNNIVNHNPALEEVARIIKLSRLASKNERKRPEGIFLFLGPAGVGKSYTAKKIAEYLYGSASKLRTIDLAGYKKPEDKKNLIIDADGNMGPLIKEIEMNPFSVILFENINKAHSSILSFLGEKLSKGEIIDYSGKKHCLTTKIFILSLTHIGNEVFESQIGFIKGNKVLSELVIPPKILNVLDWVDEIIEFLPLNEESLKQIAKMEINGIKEEVKIKFGSKLVFEKNIIEVLSKGAAASGGSAHKLVEFIEREIRGKLIDLVTSGKKSSNEYKISFVDNQISIKEI
ncbi:MAG: AAA family ATPase [Acidobacteriota bacterium]